MPKTKPQPEVPATLKNLSQLVGKIVECRFMKNTPSSLWDQTEDPGAPYLLRKLVAVDMSMGVLCLQERSGRHSFVSVENVIISERKKE